MTPTTTDIGTIPRIRRGVEARELALAVYSALIDELRDLEGPDWDVATVCGPWTVADIVRHLLGAAKSNASMKEMIRQQSLGFRSRRKFDGNVMDAFNAIQVADHRNLAPREAVDQLQAIIPTAVAGRMKKRTFFDRINIPLDQGGSTATGMPPKLNMGDLFRVIYTRDVFLHRIDIASALGRTPRLDPAIDGRIIEDVIREWSDRHGQPFDLTLTGALETRYVRPGEGPTMALDPIDLCLILSGRRDPGPSLPGSGLLVQRVLF